MIGTHRLADTDVLNERLDLALKCYTEATDEYCNNFDFGTKEVLNDTEIE